MIEVRETMYEALLDASSEVNERVLRTTHFTETEQELRRIIKTDNNI
jgi:hypothetical protein